MPIPFIDLQAQRQRLGDPLEAAILEVVRSGAYVMGPQVAAFEAALTDRVHLGADNYGPVVGRTTRAMGDGRTLKQTRGAVLRCDGCTPAGVAALLHRPPRVRPVLDGRAHLVRRSYVAELIQYLSWVGTCPEFASEPAIPAPDHAGPTRETAAEPA